MTRHVLHVIGSLERAGAEMVALDLVKNIPSSIVSQTFVCLSGNPGVLAPEFEHHGARVLAPKGGRLARYASALWLIRRIQADVVQSHVLLSSGWFLIFARLSGVRTRVARIHSAGDGHSNTIPRRVYRWLSRWALRRGATQVLAVSTAALEFAQVPTSRGGLTGEVVPNGVDVDRFIADQCAIVDPKVFLHVGRNNAAKNRAALPAILGALREQEACYLRVVGSEDSSDIGGCPEGMILEGPLEDLSTVYPTVSALVLPSVREGLPGVVLEALSCGVPAVVSDIPTLRELSGRVKGITLIEVNDAPREWANALIAAANVDISERLAIRNSIVTSGYSLESQIETWTRAWGAKE